MSYSVPNMNSVNVVGNLYRPSTSDAKTCVLLGSGVENDGDGSLYYWDPAVPVTSANGDTIIAVDAGPNGCWVRIFQNVVMVGDIRILSGLGSPEGAIAANAGSIFLQTDGSTDQILWVKEIGSGNTGWKIKPTKHANIEDPTVGDDHTQYALLAGRTTGQTIIGGTGSSENIIFQSTSNPTKGNIQFGASSSNIFDETNGRFGIGTGSPETNVHVAGTSNVGLMAEDTDAGVDVKKIRLSSDSGIGYLSAPNDAYTTFPNIASFDLTNQETNFLDNHVKRPVLIDWAQTVNSLGTLTGGLDDIDFESGNIVTATISTATQEFTFSNPPSSGTYGEFLLILTNGGSQAINWPGSVSWIAGAAPNLAVSGIDILRFNTTDGGTTWYGIVYQSDANKNTMRTLTSSDSVALTDKILLLDGGSAVVTATLPTAVGIKGRTFTLKAIDITNTVSIATTSSQTIDEEASYTFPEKYKVIKVISDGANWYAI